MKPNPSGVAVGAPSDYVVQFSRVLGSSVTTGAGRAEGVSYSIEGLAALDLADPASAAFNRDANKGERNEQAEVFGALGVMARPLPPEGKHHAVVMALRTADGLLPIAARDLRLGVGGSGLAVGAVALVGYGGGFHVVQPVDPKNLSKGAIQILYCPFQFNGSGVPAKAHTITLDPTPGNESITIAHADGMAVSMGNGQLTLRSKDGSAFITLDGGDLLLNGNVKITGALQFGGPAGVFPVALVGAPPGTPLLGGPALSAFGG
jgi:hypothetical protein